MGVFCMALGAAMLMVGKVQFGYINRLEGYYWHCCFYRCRLMVCSISISVILRWFRNETSTDSCCISMWYPLCCLRSSNCVLNPSFIFSEEKKILHDFFCFIPWHLQY